MKLWNNCSTTPDAWRELQVGIMLGRLPENAWATLPITALTDLEQDLANNLSNILGAGERSCIAVAVNRKGLFVTDDRKARQLAMELGVEVTGTLGILTVAVERKAIYLADANRHLTQMIQNGYRSPFNELDSLIS